MALARLHIITTNFSQKGEHAVGISAGSALGEIESGTLGEPHGPHVKIKRRPPNAPPPSEKRSAVVRLPHKCDFCLDFDNLEV